MVNEERGDRCEKYSNETNGDHLDHYLYFACNYGQP